MSILPEQCRAARGLVDATQSDLAAAAGISTRTLIDFESGARSPTSATISVIEQAIARLGVELIRESDGKGPGVRLKEPPPPLPMDG